ncbi:MAG: DUF4349 domain-containing protein [Chloroflexi bacterium]|nr:DUF4349 domain-containing protein [Chloroflexota bacterium]
MKRIVITITLLATLLLAACGGAASPLPRESVVSGEAAPSTGFSAPAGLPAQVAPAADGAFYAPEAQDVASTVALADRLVIKNANLSITVDDTTASVDVISHLAESLGGYVVSLNTFQTTYGPDAKPAQQANLTIRVPSDKLNEVLSQIKGMAVEVKSETISGQDVTSEYTDLRSRLTNLEAAEKQLQSIMAEATKTEDVLAVYNQLVYTREQIEVIKGQMKYYEESAALSAINLDLIPNIATQPIEVGGWHPDGVAKQAIEDALRFLQNFTDGLIYFGIARLPFLLIVGLPALFVGRMFWRRTKKNAPKAATTGTD